MRIPVLLAITIGIVVLDQLTKWLVWTNLTLNQSVPLFGNVLMLTYCHNTGGAFSLLPGARWFFLTTGVVVSLVLIFSLPKISRQHPVAAVAYALILGGAIGNLIDRSLYGYVVDFLDLGWWPVFNVADSGITVGIALLFYCLITGKDQEIRDCSTAAPSAAPH